MNDPNALVALVSEIDKNTARFATTPSLDRARGEPCSFFALPKLSMIAPIRINSILFTNAARALGSVAAIAICQPRKGGGGYIFVPIFVFIFVGKSTRIVTRIVPRI